nr:ATP-dependent helicase [Sphaerochaetaceae bacterium]
GREGLTNFIEKITLDNTVLGDDDPRDKDGVKLMTIHTVKGLEFDRVFVTGLEEALIPGIDVTEEDVEEERRLFYVAVTRARKELYMSHSGSRQTFGQWNRQMPSRFLREIPREYYTGSLDRSDLGGFTNRFAFEPRRDSFSNRFASRPSSSIENRPSWAQGVSLPPTKKSVKLIKSADFKVGDRVVESEKREAGVVTSVEVTPMGTRLKVKYDNGKSATYNAAFARLERESEKVEWSVGDRISIDGMGSGKVTEVRSANGRTTLRVSFDRGGMGLYNAAAPTVHKL